MITSYKVRMSLFIMMVLASTTALAEEVVETVAPKQASMWTSFIPLVLIMVVFYFLLIRPQQRKVKEHQNMVASLVKGTKVMTAGGIVATVVKTEGNSNIITVEIAPDVKIQIRKDSVTEVISS
ncbi:preprotein translocase subunit YajC [Alphaproteobacteria bacterium]